MVLVLPSDLPQSLAFLGKGRSGDVEVAQQIRQMLSIGFPFEDSIAPGADVRVSSGTKASVAAAIVRRANRTAARLSHRAEACLALRYNDADCSSSFARLAYAFRGGAGSMSSNQ